MPDSIEEGMASQAKNFIESFRGEGAPVDAEKLDYSEESIALVDSILEDFFAQQEPLPEDLHFLASAYVFECARKQYGGSYLKGDEQNPFVLVIGHPEFQIGFCAMEKVAGRAKNGEEDSLVFFYQGIQVPFEQKQSVH